MMKIKYSYDYENLIQEMNEELEDGILTQDSIVYVERGEPVGDGYKPIIDWWYEEDAPKGLEKITVWEMLSEMIMWDKII